MKLLKPEQYFQLTSLVFLIIAGAHGYRVINDLPAMLGIWQAPMWLSWVAIVIALYLAYNGYQHGQK